MRVFAVMLIAAFLPIKAMALVDPHSSKYDSRVKVVEYNPDDVVRIDSVIGVSTSFIVEDGEEYVDHTFGDGDAWAIKYKKNYYSIKPKQADGDTNLFLATTKRTYMFDVRYHELPYTKGKGEATFDKRMTFLIRFKYPEVEARKNAKKKAKDKVTDALKVLDRSNINLDYLRNGDATISPVNVWDNGIHTYFKFAPGQLVPVIYAVDPKGVESIVNFHACTTRECVGNVVVVHSLSNSWYLRRGEQVAGIYRGKNKGARDSLTGTMAPNVKRVIKE